MQNQINLSEMQLPELKALAYDLILERDRTSANLNVVQQEINKRNTQPVQPVQLVEPEPNHQEKKRREEKLPK